MELAAILISPVLVMVVASRLFDLRRRWPPKVAVLIAAVVPAGLLTALTGGLGFFLSPLAGFFGLFASGLTYAVVRPR